MCAFLNKYLYPFGGYVEKICFRISCLRGRSSSSSPPGFVREDEKLVNTVPVVCFCRFWRNCLSSVHRYRIFSPTISKEFPVICPEVNILDNYCHFIYFSRAVIDKSVCLLSSADLVAHFEFWNVFV